MSSTALPALCALLVVGSVCTVAAAPAAATGGPTPRVDAPPSANSTGATATEPCPPESEPDPAVERTVRIERLPNESSALRVTVDYDLAPSVATLTVDLPANATVRETAGFAPDRFGDDDLTLSDDDAPRVVYVQRSVPSERFDGDRFAVTDDWAVVPTPELTYYDTERQGEFVSTGPADGVTTTATANGTALLWTPEVAVLGEYEETGVRVAQACYAVVAVGGRTPAPAAAHDLLSTARAGLAPVGEAALSATVVVAEDPLHDSGVRTDDGVAVVNDPLVERSRPRNAWLHGYVRTRIAFETTPGMAWLRYGLADYYGALYSLRSGRLTSSADYDQFAYFHAYVSTTAASDAVLTRPGTWPEDSLDPAPRAKGRRVLAALDLRIRAATGGERDLRDVFARLNDREDPVDYAAFERAVVAVGGDGLAGWLDRYVRGRDAPPVPDAPYRFAGPDDADADDDGLTVAVERREGTSPYRADTDGDGLVDGVEVTRGTDPTDPDTDGDGEPDGTDPTPAGTTTTTRTTSERPTTTDRTTAATPPGSEETTADPGEPVPGFGVLAVLAALVVGLLLVGVATLLLRA